MALSGAPAGTTPTPAWLKRALAVGPVIGSLVAGGLLWLPTHDANQALTTTLLSFVVLAGLRAADPLLAPLWRPLAGIPRLARVAASFVVGWLYSTSQFTRQAAGKEIGTARRALLVSIVLAYVLMRPTKQDR